MGKRVACGGVGFKAIGGNYYLIDLNSCSRIPRDLRRCC